VMLSSVRDNPVAGRRIAILLVLLGAIALLAAAGGCGRHDRFRPKVVLIGIDGLDWNVADPLLKEGKLPNIARIIEGGARADFQSLEYGSKSPIIWTTIATGKGPQKHGIADFLENSDKAPLYNSNGWLARAVWDILGEAGYSVGVINWMVSWPAQPVNGYNVTDRIVFTERDGFDPIERTTYPEELLEELEPLQSAALDTPDETIAPLLNGDVWRTGEVPACRDAATTVRIIYSNDQTVANVAEYLLETRDQPDFFAVYLNGADVASHYFWGPMDPSTVDLVMPDELIEMCKDVIPRYYQRMDGIVGEILGRIDDDSTVILCSDHGFQGPVRTKQGLRLGIWMHRPVGVFAASGPGIARGERPIDASVFDVTPTLLAMFGVPVGRDMDGFVLTDILDPDVLARRPVEYIDTHERPKAEGGEDQPIESPVDDEIKERLKSLGYIE
jgi:predicted AlkP superfamily phosphohydrolase/phosphomutase